jgi:hypothetical protein
MFRIDNASAVPGPPSPAPPFTPPVTEVGGRYFTDGSAAGSAATLIQSEWLNMVQEELCQLVTSTGGTLQKDVFDQVAYAMGALVGAGAGPPGTPGTGSSIEEPPDDDLSYSRNRDPGEEDGYWTRAIDEPLDDGLPYNRAVDAGQTPAPPLRPEGRWVRASGQNRLGRLDAATYYVRRGGSDANPGTDLAPWATIQHAVDAITLDTDANGRVVTVNVGDDQGVPWDGFTVTRPLIGMPPHGFRIVGNTANPAQCRLGQIPKYDVNGDVIPGSWERFSVYTNNAKIALSGFMFIANARGNIFVRADENTAAISLEQGIVFEPMVPPDAQAGPGQDPEQVTYANVSACRGAIVYLRANHMIKNYLKNFLLSGTIGRRLLQTLGGGKIIFSPGVTITKDPTVIQNGYCVGVLHEALVRGIIDFGFTGQIAPGISAGSNLVNIAGSSILSAGNDWEVIRDVTAPVVVNYGTRLVATDINGFTGIVGQLANASTVHRGTPSASADPGSDQRFPTPPDPFNP